VNLKQLCTVALALAVAVAGGCKRGGGEDAADDSYAVTVTPPPAGRVGEPMSAKIRVEPQGEYKMNLEYPAKLQVQGPMGAAPMRQVINRGDAQTLTEQELIMAPAAAMGRGGEHKFSGKLSFSVCTDAVCEVKNKQVSWTVSVQE